MKYNLPKNSLEQKYEVSVKKCSTSNTDGPSILDNLTSSWEVVDIYDTLSQVENFLKSNYSDKRFVFKADFGRIVKKIIFEHEPDVSKEDKVFWEKYSSGKFGIDYETVKITPVTNFYPGLFNQKSIDDKLKH